MPSSFAAVLDACVVIPAALPDTLFRASVRGWYRLSLSDAILDEVQRNLVEDQLTTPEKAASLVRVLRLQFHIVPARPIGLLEPCLTNDVKDRHVLAAAILAVAQVIVTHNLTDFPSPALQPFGIAAQHPDEFLMHLFDLSPDDMAQLVQEQAAALQRNNMTVDQVLNNIRLDAPGFADQVRRRLGT